MILNTPNTCNIFTDASIIKTIYGETIGCAGAIGYLTSGNKDPIISTKIIRESTNNNSEITAILLGVGIALSAPKGFKINLFSDSKICIYGLREWIYSWMNNREPDGTMVSSSGTPVANQEVFLHIINLITTNNLSINLYHQKGHVKNTKSSLDNAKKVFFESNGVVLDDQDIFNISSFNNYIDEYTRAKLNTYVDNKGNAGKNVTREITCITQAIEREVTEEMIFRYQSLVNK